MIVARISSLNPKSESNVDYKLQQSCKELSCVFRTFLIAVHNLVLEDFMWENLISFYSHGVSKNHEERRSFFRYFSKRFSFYQMQINACKCIWAQTDSPSVGNNMFYCHVVLLYLLSSYVLQTTDGIDAGGMDQPRVNFNLIDLRSIPALVSLKDNNDDYTCIYFYRPTWPCFRK